MRKPLRFKPVNPAHEMVYSADGGWVSWEDYARLKAEVERLRAAGDTLVAAYCMGDRNKERWAEYPVVREWLAAKGELP
jgi:hypothetical protein